MMLFGTVLLASWDAQLRNILYVLADALLPRTDLVSSVKVLPILSTVSHFYHGDRMFTYLGDGFRGFRPQPLNAVELE